MNGVRIAVLGCGSIAHKHVQAIHSIPEADLAGCADQTPEFAQRFAQAYGIKAFDSYDALLNTPEVDAVSICTPSGLHMPQAIQAIQHGKHVLLEKPMSLTLEDADRLIDAVEESGLKVGIISQFRFTPAVVEIRRAIAMGAFGHITSGSLQMKYWRSREYYASGAWRGTWAMDGGGALMNQGIHGIDVFRCLMGTPKTITGLIRTQTHAIEVEDSAVAILEFENGALGIIEGSSACYPGYARRIEICGDKGSVVLEEDAILRWDLDIPCSLPVGKNAEYVASSDPMAITSEGHKRQYLNFVNAILHDEPLLVDARAGRLPLEIILGIYRSSQSGKSISLEQMRR